MLVSYAYHAKALKEIYVSHLDQAALQTGIWA